MSTVEQSGIAEFQPNSVVVDYSPGFKRKKKKVPTLFGSVLRIGVVFCLISASVYYGGLCTEKYISRPETITQELIPLTDLPPIQWSICRQVYFVDCKTSRSWDMYSYDYIETGCEYDFDDFGLYASSKDEYWSEIDERLMSYQLKDIVDFIEVWNDTSKNWNRVVIDTYFRSQMIIQDENTGFWCHTLQINNPENIRYKPTEQKSLPTGVIHFVGGLSGAMQDMLPLNYKLQYVSTIEVVIKVVNLTNVNSIECSNRFYHECLDEQFNNLDSECALPFDVHSNISVCSSYQEGLNVLKNKLARSGNCKESCIQLDVEYVEKPEQFLLSTARFKYVQAFVESSNKELGYVFKMPKNAVLVESKLEYTLPIALGYFGSIVGIFIGTSVIGFLSWVTGWKKIKEGITKWLLLLAKLVMSVYLLSILILLFLNYLEYPRATTVNFAKTPNDYSITVCSSVYVYGVLALMSTKTIVMYDMFFMKNISFWQTWSNPTTIIDTITLYNKTHEIDLLVEKHQRKFSLLPIDNQTVAACHSFDLTAQSAIESIVIIYNKEIQVYFHNNGQLLYEWIKQQNQILPVTKENTNFARLQISIHHTAIALGIERHSTLNIKNQYSYDECVIDYLTQMMGQDVINCYFSANNDNCIKIFSNTTLELTKHYLENQQKCKPPGNVLLTTADKSALLSKTDFKVEDQSSPDSDTTGSLEIESKPQNGKLKTELIFPKFTKFNQEYYSYTIGSFLGEFGGLVGILLGLSFLDLKLFSAKLKQKKAYDTILYFCCISVVSWQLYDKIQIFVQKPTTANVKLVESKDLPVSFTLCKLINKLEFDGNFNKHTESSLKNITILYHDTDLEMMENKKITFEFISMTENPLMCKEFDFTGLDKDAIRLVREIGHHIEKNLHLYIHQPGMFLYHEFRSKYQSDKFNFYDIKDTSQNVKIEIESYDISNDPHLTCSFIPHLDCTNKEIIQIYNSTFGCTFPIQRELYGVDICPTNDLVTLKNITRNVMNSNVCQLPCNLYYYHLHDLPGTNQKLKIKVWSGVWSFSISSKIPNIETIRKDIQKYNLLYYTAKVPVNKQSQALFPNSWYFISISKKILDNTRSFTFYINSLSVSSITESKLLYNTWDYIYEIGGWIGLFLGYSVIDIFDEVVGLMVKIKNYF